MAVSIPAVHAVSLLQFAPYLAEHDVDVLAFFSRQGLSPNIFQLHDSWLPRDLCLRLSSALAEETGNPFAGAFLGNSVPVLAFGEFGRRLSGAETVQTCCTTAIRNLGLVHRGSRITTLLERKRLVLRFQLDGGITQDPRQFTLATLAVLRNVILLGGEPDLVTVRLSIPRESACSVLEECLGENLEFGCQHDEIIVRGDLLEKPLNVPTKPARTEDALRTTVKAAVLLSKRLPALPVSIDIVASELGLTRRTMQRRLADCGVAFSALLDITRRDVAIRRLLEGQGSLKALALDLGYSDQAHFTRSFRRWTGEAPTNFVMGGV